jgi:L-galactonate dehydratase
MNPAGDYSAAYLILHTNNPSTSLRGHGFAFTIGRGNDLVCQAATYVASRLVNKSLAELTADMGATWRDLVSDSQLRWIGPEKGVIHLGLSATVNALWDLWGRWAGKPVWKLVADMSPEEVVRCVDFRYITDALSPAQALEILKAAEKGKQERLKDVENNTAVPAYSTNAGWLGFSDERMVELMKGMMESGFDKFKLKVGGSVEDDIRRMRIARSLVGPDGMLMTDANQVWDVEQAVEWMKKLVEFKPAWVLCPVGS